MVSRTRYFMLSMLVFPWAALAQGAGAVEVVRRVVPTETLAGLVLVRDAFEVDLRVPVRCEDGGFACQDVRRLPRVYRLEFQLERVRVHPDHVERTAEPRGTIHLALHFDDEDEREFEERLSELLSGLSAAAFAVPHAGTWAEFGSTDIAQHSIEPSYACRDDGDTRRAIIYSRTVKRLEDGTKRVVSSGTTGFSDEAIVDGLCAGLEDATEPSRPRVVRTIDLPRAYEDVTLSLESTGSLPEELYPDELVRLPEGVSFVVSPTPAGVLSYSKNSLDSDTGTYDSELAFDGTVQRVETTPAALPPLALRGARWIGRWTLRRANVRLGASPREEAGAGASFVTVLLPTLPPTKLDAEGRPRDGGAPAEDEPLEVSADLQALVADVATELDEGSALTLDAVEDAITSRPAGLGPPGWLLVVCREDGTGSYWLPPTPAHSPLTNADLFCAEARRQLGAR